MAKTAARRAGDELLGKYWRRPSEVAIVSDPDVANIVTNADEEAFRLIESTVREAYPDDLVAGEEAPEWDGTAEDGQRVWLVDSIDGTINFHHGIPQWCTAIGVGLWNGRTEELGPLCAAVYAPALAELYYAVEGGAAFCEDTNTGDSQPLRLSDETSLERSVIASHLSTTYGREMERFVESGELSALCMASRRLLMLGCGQLALCYVAAGRLMAFASVITHYWDVFAGKIIVEAAARGQEGRGIVTDLRSRTPWTCRSRGVLAACTRELHEALEGLIGPPE